MSATNRGATRVDRDFYPTNAWIVWRFLEQWDGAVSLAAMEKPWLEPCAGEGSIVAAVNDWYRTHEPQRLPTWHGVELNADGATVEKLSASGAKTIYPGWDFLKWSPNVPSIGDPRGKPYAVAMTNPPYSIAWDVIKHAMLFADRVVMLLRLNFLGSEARVEWFKQNPPDVYVLPNRPSFGVNQHGKKGTDGTEYAWFVWGHGRDYGKIQTLNLTPDSVRATQWNEAFGHLLFECTCTKCKGEKAA